MGSSPLTRGKLPAGEVNGCELGLIPAHAGKTHGRDRRRRPRQAHPRSRGENQPGASRDLVAEGSSPLTRGKRLSRGAFRRASGLIPAHAGKTTTTHRTRWQSRAHPRSRGENEYQARKSVAVLGSSPLTRGKQCRLARPGDADGLIPAHAGKTQGFGELLGHGRAHPRSRGENTPVSTCTISPRGSSPLTRGKRTSLGTAWIDVGLIPAHAGKTPARPAGQRTPGAHPRSRGENFRGGGRGCRLGGSSPLTRGKLERAAELLKITGLIPAHAGKTVRGHADPTAAGAHPRSRGENSAPASAVLIAWGSSPLTRGKLVNVLVGQTRSGLIPAHAGKTVVSGGGLPSGRAHPRSRGENEGDRIFDRSDNGSSPLTRGKRHPRRNRRRPARLIPAHAGKTGAGTGSVVTRGAHPRSRGENALDFNPNHTLGGSSPLTRGKLPPAGVGGGELGLIPAHAGKTRLGPFVVCHCRAHPRSRGENMSAASARVRTWGSSPLTRGKRRRSHLVFNCWGLIPAHAGKTHGR